MVHKTLIIAEIGVNHNGNTDLAKKLVYAAAEAGADVAKFQAFKAAAVVTRHAPKAEYQLKTTGADESQEEMLARLELTETSLAMLKETCRDAGIEFLATPFDQDSVDVLCRLGLNAIKIPSGEITNLPYLRQVGALGLELLLSTGMSTLDEVDAAIRTLEQAGTPRGKITLFHCTTEYPAPFADVNLMAMRTMREAFPGVAGVGYSDHTPGIEIPVAAVAMGATVIEKHFTLDKNMEGPDHKASLEPHELAAMVQSIRNVEAAMGDGVKRAAASEMGNIRIARKSLVAARDIRAGEILDAENLTTKRPGSGISPMLWDFMVGKVAPEAVAQDTLIPSSWLDFV
ncbi:N-acetylneuraminate synthase [Desulfovibrio sp. OttesenSCG-928-C06]|nr:N-acetylneuraminate synthase [Desulfovibrio sp. OttesenSCG-928-C06]